jgi:signal recognition particle receptor subunit beta
MSYLDPKSGELVLRIIYDGIGEAGKTTNVAQLKEMIALARRGYAESPGTLGPRTQYFDWLDFAGGFVAGRRVRCQLITVPGQAEFLHRRKHLLAAANAIVYVADSRRRLLDATRNSFKSTQSILEGFGNGDSVHFVVQANKQDCEDVLSPEQLREALGLAESQQVIRAIASEGVGVMDAFIVATRLATERVRFLLQERDVDALGANIETPESLFAAIQSLDAIATSALERAEMVRRAQEEAAQRLAHEKEQAERLAHARAEAERLASEESERFAREQADAQRLAQEEAQAEERSAREKMAAEREEAALRMAQAKIAEERAAAAKREAERIAEAERIFDVERRAVAERRAQAERAAQVERAAVTGRQLQPTQLHSQNENTRELSGPIRTTEDAGPFREIAEAESKKPANEARSLRPPLPAPRHEARLRLRPLTEQISSAGPNLAPPSVLPRPVMPRPSSSIKLKAEDEGDDEFSQVIQLFDSQADIRKNTCSAATLESVNAHIDLSAGHVWPPLTGRALLANAIGSTLDAPSTLKPWAIGFSIEIENVEGWTFHSDGDWCFENENEAKRNLLATVRYHVNFQNVIPRSRVLFIAADAEKWRMWMLTGPVQSITDSISANGRIALRIDSMTGHSLRDAAARFFQHFDGLQEKLVRGSNFLGLEDHDLVLLSAPRHDRRAESDPERFIELRELFSSAA